MTTPSNRDQTASTTARRHHRWLAPALLAFALGACGDDDSSDNSAEPSPDAEVVEESRTIVDIAVGNDDFSILVAALQKAELVEALQGEGPFTVFAPTNEAFTNAGITDLDAFSKEELADILLYHVVSGDIGSDELPAKADTLLANEWGNGVSVLFKVESGANINDSNIVTVDIEADNGVIHVIDAPILPPNIVDMAGIAGFTSLVGAVGAAADIPDGPSIAAALSGDGPLTVFAPTNDAFAAITVPEDPNVVRDVLLLHVVGAETPVMSTGLPSEASPLLANETLTINGSGPTISSDGTANANIAITDINVTNGVIHVIDKVLLP